MNSWNELTTLMRKHANIYINHKKVLFNSTGPGKIVVESEWPGFKSKQLSIIFFCNQIDVFYNKMEINSAAELEDVKPETLLKLFNNSEALILCSLNEHEFLEFEINDHALIATYDPGKSVHEVIMPVRTPTAFISYTIEYFKALRQLRQQQVASN